MIKMKSKEQQKIFNTLSGKYFGKTLTSEEVKRYTEMIGNKEGFKSMREIASMIRNN